MAIGWLVLRLTGSAAELGLVMAAGGVPSLLLGPWGGTIADRVGLRGLLIVTQTAYGALAAALWALAVAGHGCTVGQVLSTRRPPQDGQRACQCDGPDQAAAGTEPLSAG